MKSDIEIAQETPMNDIREVAKEADIPESALELYGNYKAKINIHEIKKDKKGKVILVTALTPTPAGEGKTTISVGLADSMRAYLKGSDKNVMLALREPSLGPVFGIKGGAAGGGYSQVVPMEDINLHFTGDFHAIGAANNLLAAMLDNHIQQGNDLGIDPKSITWRRAVDMNDRQLRNIVDGLGGKMQGVPREDGFDITVASEIMAVFCLSSDLKDLKKRLGNIVVGYTYDEKPVTASDLKAQGAMTALLKDAIKPNLVQTLEHTPSLVHGGPFANIAHGCNSVIATKTAAKLADYVVTEAGFGADLGAEKFLDIKCRMSGIKPSAVVMVATVRALKLHGGAAKGMKAAEMKEELKKEDLKALEAGFPNLLQHVKNIEEVYKLPCLSVINVFPTDTDKEIDLLYKLCADAGINVQVSHTCMNGSKGSEDLAKAAIELCEKDNSKFSFSYDLNKGIAEKLNDLATKIYHADGVEFVGNAVKQLPVLEKQGFGKLPICVAKTQYSFSDDPNKRGVPKDFKITVRNLKLAAGSGFIVALTGEIMTMPGLPKVPAAEKIDVDEKGVISGLF